MLFARWDWDVAKRVWQEEAEERGEARGVAIGETKGREEVFALLKKGMSLAEIEKTLDLRKD
jgi:predicted transposase YdaD